ncbi:hypothetical protein GCM10023213_21770 [Prosthecobacter algae]|uniref:TIR domain-containing protein n=2 Tax=Prosthecobacter algae TaxID=1144682 RepID=A0ABP9P4Z8_9BACT
MPSDIASEDANGDFVVGNELRRIIDSNGFSIHPDKVHLYRNTTRQSVTGLVVNRRVNVPREFIRNIRAMISDWHKNGLDSAEKSHHEKHYRRALIAGLKPPLPRIIEGKLNFLRMVKGIDDPVRRNLQRQFVNVYPEYQKVMEKENSELSMRDLFISHASEDKDAFVRPLVQALVKVGVSVWYDEAEMTIGDKLTNKINEGLTKSRYGLVVLSPSFFSVKKTWPDREVNALFAMEDADGNSRVLPLWYKVDKEQVSKTNPLLAGQLAWKAADFSVDVLAEKFRDFMKNRRSKDA